MLLLESKSPGSTKGNGAGFLVLLPAVVYLVAIACFVKDPYSLFQFPLDDAWIHRVYSRSFALGHGFNYNAGQQEAGSTSPLWAIVTSPAQWCEPFGTEAVVILVKLIGVLLGLVTLRAMIHMGRQLSGSNLVGCLSASLFALEPRFLFSSLSGMETNLLLALWAGAGAALIAGRPLLSVVLFSLTPVTRPEAIVLLPLSVCGLMQLSRERGWRPSTILAWTIPCVPLASWMAFCAMTTGHYLPNTFYLKARPFQLGFAELSVGWRSLLDHGLMPVWVYLLGMAVFLGACFTSMDSKKGWSLTMMVAAPSAYLIGVVGTRQVVLEGYYWTRWVDPACLMLMMACCMGYGIIVAFVAVPREALSEERWLPTRHVLSRVLVGMATVGCLVAAIPPYCDAFVDRRGHLSSDARDIRIMNVRAGEWINAHTPPGAVVDVNDAGAIRYFGQRQTIDLLGLNDAAIAFGKMSRREAIANADWLAVFPAWFQGTGIMADMLAAFEPRVEIQVPSKEYTVCKARDQTLLVVFERKSPKHTLADVMTRVGEQDECLVGQQG